MTAERHRQPQTALMIGGRIDREFYGKLREGRPRDGIDRSPFLSRLAATAHSRSPGAMTLQSSRTGDAQDLEITFHALVEHLALQEGFRLQRQNEGPKPARRGKIRPAHGSDIEAEFHARKNSAENFDHSASAAP